MSTAHPTRLNQTEADQLAQQVKAAGYHMNKIVERASGGYIVTAVGCVRGTHQTWRTCATTSREGN